MFSTTAFGQSGDFTVSGKVVNTSGQALAGATITYMNVNKSLSWDFSRADGTFGGPATATIPRPNQTARLTLASAGSVTLDVFDMTGKKLSTIVNPNMAKGTYSLEPVFTKLSKAMYFVKITANGSVSYQKLVNTGKSARTSADFSLTASASDIVLAKRLATVDSIRVGKTGYKPVYVPIATYNDAITTPIALTAINIDAQVDSIFALMTLPEKLGQLAMPPNAGGTGATAGTAASNRIGSIFGGGGALLGSTAAASASYIDGVQNAMMGTPRKIPIMAAYDFVHGASAVPGATMFPHNLAMGAIQDTLLIQKAFRVTALEVRGAGLNWGFGPCIAVIRDFRWGRSYEGFCETPERTQLMARHAVLGIQTTDLSLPQAYAACAKHFAGDGNTTNGVNQGETVGPDATARSINLPGYTSAVQTGVATIMPSFSSWCDNIPMHQNKTLLTGWLKSTTGPNFQGFLVSDYEAGWPLPTCTDAGVDVPMAPGTGMGIIATNDPANKNNFTTLYNSGGTFPARIDDAVKRVLRVKCWMNLFDPKQYLTDTRLTALVGNSTHRDVARACVRASQVLLKNSNNVLPIPKTANVAVMGQAGQDIGVQCGAWTVTWQGQMGSIPGGGGTTILQGIQSICTGTVTPSSSGPAVSSADYVIAFLGENPYAETSFPGISLTNDVANEGSSNNVNEANSTNASVITNIAAAHAAGKKVIGVLISGRPLDISAVIANCDAFVWSCIPGSEGKGVAEVLFADQGYKFSGKLPFTWPANSNYNGYSATGLFANGFGLTD